MSRIRLRTSLVPGPLTGWVSINDLFQPRFWATIWADVLMTAVDDSTRGAHLASVDLLYRFASEQLGQDGLDAIIGDLNFDAIEAVLGGFLTQIRNRSAIDGTGHEKTWKSAVRFIHDVMTHLNRASGEHISNVEARLSRLERLYSQITPRPAKPAAPIRALPALVVEELYGMFDPTSPRNPFRSEGVRWRNYLLFLILLHLGLRRGEAMIMPADAVKEEFDPASGRMRLWVNIDETPYEDEDPRASAPGLKTQHSRRQLPVSAEIVRVSDVYLQNYRRRPSHSYLFNSQKNGPLAAQTLADIFLVVSDALSPQGKAALSARGKASITPHDLRHTSAVHRLAKYVSGGLQLDAAIERLRVFFGWSPQSDMPRHYARAYFETSLAEVWDENFDSFVETLRAVEGKSQ